MGRKHRAAWTACCRIGIESQPVMTTLVGRFIEERRHTIEIP